MALKPMNPGAVSTATVVSDLPDMPQDLADKTAVAKWWFDTRLVFQRLLSDIERRRNVGGTEPATEYSPTWDSITGKPDKFPPEDHSHVAGKATPLVQVVAEDPLVAGTTDPDTGNADIGFHEQTAATFLAGPVIGPPQLPVFRPILLSDLPASVRDMPTGGDPGTYDDLNGTTGGGTPEGIIAVQARGGSWSLAGEPEFTQAAVLCDEAHGSAVYLPEILASVPPRRYRTIEFSGACAEPNTASCFAAWVACSGQRTINATTLAITDTTTASGDSGGPISGLTPAGMPWSWAGGSGLFHFTGDYPCNRAAYNIVESRTRRVAGLRASFNDYLNCETHYIGGQVVAELLDEDTPDSAIARLMSGSPEWASAPTTAIRTIRTDGITGLYREARYRTEHTAGAPAVTSPTLLGLSPWQRYQLTVTLESRPVDSAGAPTGDGAWSAAGTRQHYFVANLDGEGGIDWQTVEPTAGYETRIASTLVEVA